MNKILTVGRELIKGNFGTAVKSLSIDPGKYTHEDDGHWMIGAGGVNQVFTWTDHNSSLKAYTSCPPLTAIINRKAQAYINGKTWVMNTQGKEANSEDAKKIKKLFSQPNPIQSWKQFEAQQQIYTQLFGFSILLPIIPKGFEKYGAIEATSLWNIPPYMLDIEETDKLFYQTDMKGIVKNIKLRYKNADPVEIPANSIHIFKDITPSFNSLIFPDSRVRSLTMPINNIVVAYESRFVIGHRRGALGILSNDPGTSQYAPIAINPDEKKQLQDDFRRYGLRADQYSVIITSASLKWQQMGVSIKDLMLIEEVQESAVAICQGYNYPPFLFGLRDATFNNQNTAEKALYQNAIIPEAESAYEQWNRVFQTSDKNINIIKDYSELPVLQEDMQSKASARKILGEALEKEYKNDLITLNRWLELVGENTRPDGDVYYSDWIKQHQSQQNQNNGQQQEGQGQEEDQN